MSEKPIAPHRTGEEYQKEQIANQPFKRGQTPSTGPATDKKDTGSAPKGSGKTIAEEEDKGQPSRGGGKAAAEKAL